MFEYLAFLESGISVPSSDPIRDGKKLAEDCMKKLKQLNDPDQFPERLLILLASREYLAEHKAEQLIAGIYSIFSEEVPLIGSSVAAVFFDNKVSERGALLICLASRFIKARVAVGRGAGARKRMARNAAVTQVVEGLGLKSPAVAARPARVRGTKTTFVARPLRRDLSQELLPHRMILTFLSGSGADPLQARTNIESIHRQLWEEVDLKIPIVGGVSSVNDRERKEATFQFANKAVYKHSIVAALISSGAPLGENLSNGIVWRKKTSLTIKSWSADGKMIEEFKQGRPSKVFAGMGKLVLLKESPRGSDRIVAISESAPRPRRVKLLRELTKENTPLVPGRPTPTAMYREAERAILRSQQRAGITNPIGCFSIKCVSHLRYKELLKLDIKHGIAAISKRVLNRRPYVGGFFDGEIGTDHTGRSTYGNWSVATLSLGDELSENSLTQRGYHSLRGHSGELTSASDLKSIVTQALAMIHDLGFPGGMISLLMTNDDKFHALVIEGRGPRFGKLSDSVLFDLNSDDHPLARITREHVPTIFPGPIEKASSKKANASTTCSYQYVIPLTDPEGKPFALLQVDLGSGSTSRSDQAILSDSGKESLHLVGRLVRAALNRVSLWNENKTVRELDEALVDSLEIRGVGDPLKFFLEKALAAFDLKMGHIRRLDQKKPLLVLIKGKGECHEAATKMRLVLELDEQTPTVKSFNAKKPIITNDAEGSEEYRNVLDQSVDPKAREALSKVGSYAIVPFTKSDDNSAGPAEPVEGEAPPSGGTINLLSEHKWFFKEYHKQALTALSSRVRSLIEHLDNKRDEDILKEAIPILSDIKRDDDMRAVLQQSMEAFCTAIGAQFGSLYLEDRDSSLYLLKDRTEWRSKQVEDPSRSLYVLRAQYKWQSERDWVDTAFYKNDEGWIGHTALEARRPLYFENLQEEYSNHGNYKRVTKRYDVEIFGEALSKLDPIEALALPLEAGGETLGVVTVYRKVTPPSSKQPVGFKSVAESLLKQAANPFAGLLNLVWDRRRKQWDDIKESLREMISRPLEGPELQHPELNICKTLITQMSARQVDFYKVKGDGGREWSVGFKVTPTGLRRTKSPEQEPRNDVYRAADNRQVEQQAIMIDDAKKSYKGVLTRACIPLLALGDRIVVGILDVYWDEDHDQGFPLAGLFGMQFLAWIGRRIGSAYRQYDLDAKLERSRGRLDYSSIHEVNREHKILKCAKEIIIQSKTKPRLGDIFLQATEIENYFREDSNTVTLEQPRKRENLRDILLQTLSNVSEQIHKPRKTDITAHLKRCIDSSNNIWIFGLRDAIQTVLTNILENAVEVSSFSEQNPMPRIDLEKDDEDQIVRILITDNGPGPGEVERIFSRLKEGVIPMKDGRRQIGVRSSRMLAPLMRGTVEWKKNSSGGGTIAVVTLSLAEQEG
jgi:anti-sigma regulatory factor (Ser/Thr protein kinase)